MSDFDHEEDNDELWQKVVESDSAASKVGALMQMVRNAIEDDDDYPQAMTLAAEAVELSRQCEDSCWYAYANHSLVNAAVRNKKWQQVLDASEQAAPYYLGIADEDSLATLESMRAQAFEGLEQYALAVEAHRSARDLAKSFNDLSRAAWSGLSMGADLNIEGRALEALEVLEQAGEHFKQLNMMREFGFTRDMCGESYHRLRLHNSALKYFGEAHTIFEFTHTDHIAAIMEYKVGRSLVLDRKPQQAIETLTKVQARFREHGRWNYAAECHIKLGLAHALMGDLARAAATMEQAKTLLKGLDMPESSARVDIYQAQLTWMRGNAIQAFEMYSKIFDTYGTPNEPKGQLRNKFKVVQALARLSVVIGRPEKALEVLKSWGASNFGESLEHQAESLIIEAQALRALGKMAPAERIVKRMQTELAAGVADQVLVEAYEVAYLIDVQRGRKASADRNLMMATALHNKLGNPDRAAELTQAYLGDGLIGVFDPGPSGGLALADTPFDAANRSATKGGKDTPTLWSVDQNNSVSDVE